MNESLCAQCGLRMYQIHDGGPWAHFDRVVSHDAIYELPPRPEPWPVAKKIPAKSYRSNQPKSMRVRMSHELHEELMSVRGIHSANTIIIEGIKDQIKLRKERMGLD